MAQYIALWRLRSAKGESLGMNSDWTLLSYNYMFIVVIVFAVQVLQSDFHRYRNEDVPPRLEVRNKLLKLFDEIQVGSPR